ncbi:MAG: hypothetical protein ACR2RA_09885 [Geminicoccaceae bacterium]
MIAGLLLLLAVTFAATYWARLLARDRNRYVAGWMFATAMFAPIVLILWTLPRRTTPVQS